MATFRVTTVRTTNLIFMYIKVHYSAQKRMAKDPSLSQTHTLHTIILYFKALNLNTILPSKPRFVKWSHLLRCLRKTVFVFLIYCTHASSSAPLILFSLNYNTIWRTEHSSPYKLHHSPTFRELQCNCGQKNHVSSCFLSVPAVINT
jgi:hypothetical protein